MKKITIKWQEPLELAEKIADNYDKNWVFLYSALNQKVKNSVSYIALFPKKEIIAESFCDLEKIKNNDDLWFGYLSYEAGTDLEKIAQTSKSYINLPKIWLISFALICEFHHNEKELKVFYENDSDLAQIKNYKNKKQQNSAIKIKEIKSNFSDSQYLAEISDLKKMISEGTFYQVNLTRKFFGKLEIKEQNQQSYFSLFKKLSEISPANYSSFLSLNKNYIISASPELFLEINDKKNVTSKPIKGTTARSENKDIDQKNKLNLQNSAKEKAENLMIVDLVRNDLSRVCKAGSVKVKKLFEITSYQTIHHMSSTVVGKIDDNFDNIDVIQASFPAGSMTGAPKIKAMEIIAAKEKINRGIYSGAIGFVSRVKTNLSVVIRTLICNKDNFEFQSGGGITFDSDEKKELEEVFNKTKAISKLLFE